MSLARLKRLVPPVGPERSDINWAEVERAMGTALPTDYKQMVETYGVGSMDDFIWVMQPLGAESPRDLVRQRTVRLDALRELDDPPTPDRVDLSKANIIPWASTDNADVFFWLTDGEPDEWSVVAHDSRVSQWASFDGTATELLVAVLASPPSTVISFLPEDFPSERPLFHPMAEAPHD